MNHPNQVAGVELAESESLTKRLGDAELPEAAERFLDVLALPA